MVQIPRVGLVAIVQTSLELMPAVHVDFVLRAFAQALTDHARAYSLQNEPTLAWSAGQNTSAVEGPS